MEVSHFDQKEAMHMMEYKCEKCGKSEKIWNSRPRATPFIIGCSDCDGAMQHENWQKDVYMPNHQPKKGDRIFVDTSIADAKEFEKKKIERYWDDAAYPMSKMFDSKEEALERLMESWEFGQPMVITV